MIWLHIAFIVREYVFTFFKIQETRLLRFLKSHVKKRRKHCPSFHFSPLWNC